VAWRFLGYSREKQAGKGESVYI